MLHYVYNTPFQVEQTDTHLTASFLGQRGQANTRKVKPIWILVEQEKMGCLMVLSFSWGESYVRKGICSHSILDQHQDGSWLTWLTDKTAFIAVYVDVIVNVNGLFI